MYVFGDILVAAAKILYSVLQVYKWVIIIAVLVSWVNPDPYNQIVRFLYSITDPALRPVRRYIGYRLGPVDLSPLILILIIIFIQEAPVKIIMKFGYSLGGG